MGVVSLVSEVGVTVTAERLDELGLRPSTGTVGDALDNAMAEAWVASFKAELVDGRRFPSFEHAEHETLAWIGFYTQERLHEELGDIPPAEYEHNHLDDHRRFAPVEAGQPALTKGALTGFEGVLPAVRRFPLNSAVSRGVGFGCSRST